MWYYIRLWWQWWWFRWLSNIILSLKLGKPLITMSSSSSVTSHCPTPVCLSIGRGGRSLLWLRRNSGHMDGRTFVGSLVRWHCCYTAELTSLHTQYSPCSNNNINNNNNLYLLVPPGFLVSFGWAGARRITDPYVPKYRELCTP